MIGTSFNGVNLILNSVIDIRTYAQSFFYGCTHTCTHMHTNTTHMRMHAQTLHTHPCRHTCTKHKPTCMCTHTNINTSKFNVIYSNNLTEPFIFKPLAIFEELFIILIFFTGRYSTFLPARKFL